MAVIVTQRRSLWEIARQVKCHIDAGEDADALAKELLAWLLEVAEPHTADTAMLRRALDIIAEVAGR